MQFLLNMAMAWDVGSFLKNFNTRIQTWGGLFIMLLGVIMIVVGVYKLAKGLMSHGKQPVEWWVVILLILVGGALAIGGWPFVYNIAQGGKKTFEDMGTPGGSTIIPLLQSIL